jgi:ubiquitin-conjugating enzyme E2 Z
MVPKKETCFFNYEFMSTLTKKAISRIHADITSINHDDMKQLGIFYHFDETDISKGTALIIGPQDTPYEGGFWFFSVVYPPNYPFDPPAMSTLTQDGYMRFGPNLYRCGKVCLSLLNTWHVGDKWSAVQTLKSILLSVLSSVLVKGSWQNEPSVGLANGPVAEVYDRMILHSNLKTIINMIRSPPDFAKPFYETMCSSFLAQRRRLNDLAVSNIEYDNKTETMDFFRLSLTYMFSTVGDKLLECSPVNLI